MTIKYLEAQNFRSYKDIRVDFHPGVSVIIGENDSGKTNILRMINWVANNSPAGTDMFPLYWEGDTMVRLGVVNQDRTQFVERYRSTSENLYRIEGQKEPLRSFGQGVPESVQKILNISPVNIHFQLEGPFLLGQSPPDVAKHYNNAVNLEIIDRSIKGISKTIWNERQELKQLKKSQIEHEEKLKEFSWLFKAEKELIRLEKLQTKYLRIEQEFVKLTGLNNELKELNKKYLVLNEIVKYEKAVNNLIELNRQIDIKTSEYKELEGLSNKLKGLKVESKKLKDILQYEDQVNDLIQQSEKIEISKKEFLELSELQATLIELKQKGRICAEIIKFESEINRLIELDGLIGIKTDEYNELFDLTENKNKLQLETDSIKEKIEILENEFKEELPNICPILDIECEHLREAK